MLQNHPEAVGRKGAGWVRPSGAGGQLEAPGGQGGGLAAGRQVPTLHGREALSTLHSVCQRRGGWGNRGPTGRAWGSPGVECRERGGLQKETSPKGKRSLEAGGQRVAPLQDEGPQQASSGCTLGRGEPAGVPSAWRTPLKSLGTLDQPNSANRKRYQSVLEAEQRSGNCRPQRGVWAARLPQVAEGDVGRGGHGPARGSGRVHTGILEHLQPRPGLCLALRIV